MSARRPRAPGRDAAARTARRARHAASPARSRAAAVAGRPAARPRSRARGPADRAFARVRALPEHRVLDRLLRSRLWIWALGALLGGIVAMQVSLLKLNSGISRAVETTTTLERQNAGLEASIARLSSPDRIESGAATLGMLMPPAGDVGYLTRRAAGRRRRPCAGCSRRATRPPRCWPTTGSCPARSPTRRRVGGADRRPAPSTRRSRRRPPGRDDDAERRREPAAVPAATPRSRTPVTARGAADPTTVAPRAPARPSPQG